MNSSRTSENIRFKTDGILNIFDGYRDKWEDFYPSERWAFEKLAGHSGSLGRVLDIGCALGGLGLAISNKFNVEEYVGVDINQQAIDKAKSMISKFSIPVRFECEDILKMTTLERESFDTVVSLSCADWNINTNEIINRCWEHVRPGGSFVISIRLTSNQGINDITKSNQPVSNDDQGNVLEFANYVVFNWWDFLHLIERFIPRPSLVSGYGYWGKPATDAVTPYKKLVFAVFIIRKSTGDETTKEINTELFLPLNLFNPIK